MRQYIAYYITNIAASTTVNCPKRHPPTQLEQELERLTGIPLRQLEALLAVWRRTAGLKLDHSDRRASIAWNVHRTEVGCRIQKPAAEYVVGYADQSACPDQRTRDVDRPCCRRSRILSKHCSTSNGQLRTIGRFDSTI